jgi:hypothetical protein
MGRALTAKLLTVTGCLLVIAGVAVVYPPAGLIVAGLLAAGFGLFVIDVRE